MSQTIPSMTDPERSLELLREIIETSVRDNAFPPEQTVRARKVDEPWLVDDLLRHRWLTAQWFGRLVPTIQGLRSANTAPAVECLTQLQQIFRHVRAQYNPEDPSRIISIDELANDSGLSSDIVARLLWHLEADHDIGRVSFDQSSGRIQTIIIRERILEHDPFHIAAAEPLSEETGSVTLTLRDFMGLAQVEWSPTGVCLVVGPNGSGKTTLLQAFAFLRDAFQGNVAQAVGFQRGATGFRRLGAQGPPEVVCGLKVGSATWELRLAVKGNSLTEYPGEVVKIGQDVLLRRGTQLADWYLGRERHQPDVDGRTCLRIAWDSKPTRPLFPLVKILRGFRYYSNYALDAIRNGGTGSETDKALDTTGQNLFVVLRNWKTAPRKFRNQFDWVLRHVRRAFPGLLEDIEFDPPVGQVVPVRFFPPGSRTALSMSSRSADGLLVGLLHLTAVAGAGDGSIIAIDEMENQLHPHAIRSLLAAMRELADKRGLTILLTTHSPVLMNAFRDHPEQLYVMEPNQPVLPVSLDKLHDPDWLAHFELGDLYDRMEFGAPPSTQGD